MYITPCLLLYLKEVIKVVQKYVQISAFTKWKGPLNLLLFNFGCKGLELSAGPRNGLCTII